MKKTNNCVDCGEKISFYAKRCKTCAGKLRHKEENKCIDCGSKVSTPKNKRCLSCYLKSCKIEINKCIDCKAKISKNAKRCKTCNGKIHLGSNHPNWKEPKRCIDCGARITQCSKRCLSCSYKYRNEEQMLIKSGKKRSFALTGKKRKPFTLKHRQNIGLGQTGKKRGPHNPNWKVGILKLCRMIKFLFEYREWRKQIFKRDNYLCQECFKQGRKIEAHHIKGFAIIFKEFLALYSQFSPTKDKETLVRLAINYAPFWDINNGKTLCKECHILTRKKTQKGD